MKRIFVGGLPWSTTDEELGELLAQYGEVGSASVITDRETGRSRGFGFIEMANDEEADKAIEALNETEFGGRTIQVNVAREREDRPRNDRGGDRRDFSR